MARRAYRSFLMDSTRWDQYRPRPTDIVISTPAKAGTTWMQRVVSCLIFGTADLTAPLHTVSPWLDGRSKYGTEEVLAVLEGQTHRRFIKTHLPADGIPRYPSVKYIVVARDPRDTALSLRRHFLNRWETLSALPPVTGPDVHTPVAPQLPSDIGEFWRRYFTTSIFPWERDGWPNNSPTHHLASWWPLRQQPNVLLVHHQDMCDDLDGQMRRVAGFLDIPVPEQHWPDLVAACTFDRMRAEAALLSPSHGQADPARFFHGGVNGRWREAIPETDHALAEAALKRLEPALREWVTRAP